MTTTAPTLTRCLYCARALHAHPDGVWRCSRCAPLLARVRTYGDWSRFARAARADLNPT